MPRLVNPLLPAVWVDVASVTTRHDDIVQMRFFGTTPEAIHEVGKFQMSLAFLVKFKELLEKTLVQHTNKKPAEP